MFPATFVFGHLPLAPVIRRIGWAGENYCMKDRARYERSVGPEINAVADWQEGCPLKVNHSGWLYDLTQSNCMYILSELEIMKNQVYNWFLDYNEDNINLNLFSATWEMISYPPTPNGICLRFFHFFWRGGDFPLASLTIPKNTKRIKVLLQTFIITMYNMAYFLLCGACLEFFICIC